MKLKGSRCIMPDISAMRLPLFCVKELCLMKENTLSKEQLAEKKTELSAEIISLTSSALLLNMRFMAKSINKLRTMCRGEGFCSSAGALYYNADNVLRRYKQGSRLLVHDYLHVLLHNVFRHWKPAAHLDKLRWDTACDIAVETTVIESAARFCEVEHLTEKQAAIRKLQFKTELLTAERLYKYFSSPEMTEERITALNKLFCADDHKYWSYRSDKELEREEQQKNIPIGINDFIDEDDKDDKTESERSDGSDGDKKQEKKDDPNNPQQQPGNGQEQDTLEKWLDENRRSNDELLEQEWKEISQQILSELENFNKNAGNENGYLVNVLRDIDRDKYDYSAFLRRFAVSGEVMRSDPDSFDVNFYCYGLDLYGNAALIEPLEYKETKLVKDFVIAIDTSGSVSGALVESFVKKTFSILKNGESYFSKVNIYVIQCDTQIREAVKLTDSKEMEKYLREMEIKGLGGTDFRPVFEYVDKLVDSGELKNLKGMIYFTDGFGKIPQQRPRYSTAFAFMREDTLKNEPPELPAWAFKVILEEDELLYG